MEEKKYIEKIHVLEREKAIMSEQLQGMVECMASMENAYALEKANRDLIIQECSDEKEKEIELLRQQLSEAKAHIASMESEFETKKDTLRAEVEKQVKDQIKEQVKEEVKEQIKEEVKEQYSKEFQQKSEIILQEFRIRMEQEAFKAKEKFLSSGFSQLGEYVNSIQNAFLAMLKGDEKECHRCISDFKTIIPKAETILNKEIEEALAKAEKKGLRQAHHIAELVRMNFTRKSERVLINESEHETIFESVIKSIKLSETEKTEYKECYAKVKDYRERRRLADILDGKANKGHGRKVIPDSIPRLPEKVIWPEGYLGHESEYRLLSDGDVQEFILPVSVRYVVQPYRRPIVVRKDDVTDHPIQAPCYEGPIWKSYASPELLAMLECGKYQYHIPFHRQIKKMKAEGFAISDSTVDGWHQTVCEMLEPLYKLQYRRVMQSRLLAADGSPMPVVDNEKHRTVKQYIIQYRSIDTGIPIYLSTPGTGNGRGKKVIEANISEWTGQALMCDAYSGYDWVGKTGRTLCRCVAHARRGFERALNENNNIALPAIALLQNIYTVESMIKHQGLEGDAKIKQRQELALPNWEALKKWCMQHILETPEDTLSYKAMNYLLRHYDELTNYIYIADMPIDNNDTEREIRNMVMGKKAYLFCKTDEACNCAAVMYSLLGACRVLGKNAEKWLTYTLKYIGKTKTEDLHRLLPEEWDETLV